MSEKESFEKWWEGHFEEIPGDLGEPGTQQLAEACKAMRDLFRSCFNAGAERRWIPVTERMPEETGGYLTATPYEWGGWAVTDTGFYACSGKWNMPATSPTDTEIKGITHWMPLPQPPKEGEG